MMTFLMNNLATILISAVIFLIIAFVVIKLVRDKRKGKTSCGCGCDTCPHSTQGCSK